MIEVSRIYPNELQLTKWRLNYLRHFYLDGGLYVVNTNICKYLKGTKCKINSRKPELCKKFPNEQFKKVWKLAMPDCGMI